MMRYQITSWTIQKLLEVYEKGHLNLNPPYQRNDIWTEKAQKELVSSIKEGMPIPNFFLHEKGKEKYDIADGQQRSRALIAYKKGDITDNLGTKFNNNKNFLNYKISVIIINKDVTDEEIRKFYVKVNNTGLRVNSPELTKSKYFDSKVLKLVEELSESTQVQTLGLFTEKQSDRMLDREFMEELLAQLIYGITEKKLGIKKLYEENADITDAKVKSIKNNFMNIVNVFSEINKRIDLTSTRYSQKNDFYTLFGLINKYELRQTTYNHIFDFLVRIQDDISPSNEDCPLLQEYAFNCVTQSHGKSARDRRFQILEALAFNKEGKLNKEQKALVKYYELTLSDTNSFEGVLLLDSKKIKTKFYEE